MGCGVQVQQGGLARDKLQRQGKDSQANMDGRILVSFMPLTVPQEW